MTEEQYQLMRVAAVELKKEEEARKIFFDAPTGPPTPQCFSARRVREFLSGKSLWKPKEETHLNSCINCQIFVKDCQLRIEITKGIQSHSSADAMVGSQSKQSSTNTDSAYKKNPKTLSWFSYFPKWGKVSLATASLVFIAFVASNSFRPNTSDSQFPAIEQLQQDSQNLFINNVRSTSNSVTIVSPKTTAVRRNRPVFQWKNSNQAKLTLKIYRASGDEKKPYISQSVDGESWIPKQNLAPGVYYWFIIGKSSEKSAFRVLTSKEISQISKQEESLKSDRELASLYLQNQLFAEAKPILQRLYSKKKDRDLIPYLRIVANSS